MTGSSRILSTLLSQDNARSCSGWGCLSGDPARAEPGNRRAGTRTAEPATAPSV